MTKQIIGLSVLLLISLCSTANAAVKTDAMAPATPPFSINIAGVYLQPSANNMTYAVYTTPLPLTTPNWEQLTIKPDHSTGLAIGLHYAFSDKNTINIDWMTISTSDSDSFATTAANTSVAPPFYFGPLAQALTGTSASSKVEFDVNNVDLTVGNNLSPSNAINFNIYAGLNAAYLRQEITSSYLGSSGGNPYSITTDNKSRFTGIGPRAGVNATYFVTPQFGIAAKMGASLLAGTTQSNTDFLSAGAGNTTPANTSLADQNLTSIVPVVDANLEASYLIPINGPLSSLMIAAGYQIKSYFNGINQVVPTALVPGAFNGGVIAIESSVQSQSDLSLNGFYVNFTLNL
tara:strand:+ start:1177 stop:2217 length:1041 start_codon:yes stop_codon:yes gene_type:complete